MKTISNIFLIVIILLSFNETYGQNKNMDKAQKELLLDKNLNIIQIISKRPFSSLNKQALDSLLIAKSREVALFYCPEYYRDFGLPVIKLKKYKGSSNAADNKKNMGREYYEISFNYDNTKEVLPESYAFQARIWKSSGEILAIYAGNGMGIHFLSEKYDRNKAKTNSTQIPYQTLPKGSL